MPRRHSGLALLFAAALLLATSTAARAQLEFPPPQGRGPVVVVMSGHSGPGHYQAVAGQIAQLGYEVALFDAGSIAGDVAGGLQTAVRQAQQMPHALPGKVGLVGFSQGGGQVLIYGSQLPDIAAVVVAWYPATRSIGDVADFVGRVRVPVLVLAGEADTYLGTARALAAAARGRIELVSYPNVQHDFVYGGTRYDAPAHADAFRRTAATLAQYLGH
jgi:dienelactone hydrolase